MVQYDNDPHRRFNPLTGEWVLVSPHRTKRPWQGQQEKPAPVDRPQYDPKCYLCPGNERVGGHRNPDYKSTFVFTNDFSALLPDAPLGDASQGSLFRAEGVRGECRVICFSPRHDLTLSNMPVEDIVQVVDAWADQIVELGAKYRWVQIFENRGDAMGASNPHPHGQVWASDFIPTLIEREDQAQNAYFETNGRPLLLDVAEQEIERGERVVAKNDSWVVVVPFWAVWPYEYLLLPRRAVQQISDLTPEERLDLAKILSDALGKYDDLFQVSFPYSMGWHGAPTNTDQDQSHWLLHAHFYPPLLRSATVRKFMVGYEMLAESQRDLTPEMAAAKLRGE